MRGPIAIMTAEADPDRIVGDVMPDTRDGTALGKGWQELAAGPIVVTNLVHAGDGGEMTNQLGVADPMQCKSARPLVSIGYGDYYFGLTGLRMLVPKGKVLCGLGDGLARWAGFRPYEVESPVTATN
jgi:hypothetical protein